MVKILDEIKERYTKIYECRVNIANLQKEKIIKRNKAWIEATGTVDEKKDYVRSQVSSQSESIALNEANIEFQYNIIKVLENKLIYEIDEEIVDV